MAIGVVIDDQTVPKGVGQENPMPVGTEYTTKIEWSGGNPIYIGEAIPGTLVTDAKWRIKKITWDIDGNPTSVDWASSVKTFTKIWSNRASYSYG